MPLLSIRRRIEVEEEYGGDYWQFIGYVEKDDVPLHPNMSDVEKARAIIEEAYEQSSLSGVKWKDDHEISRIDMVRDVPAKALEPSRQEVEAE